LQSAEYSKLITPEHHACEVARTEHWDAFDPWSGSWYELGLYHCCRQVWFERGGQELPADHCTWIANRRIDIEEESVVTWRETEPYLSVEYLDGETAELLEFIGAELPFGRARDGNVSAWVLRAEHAGVITAADRALILAGVRAAREKFHLARGVVV
jgi:hypothetical protein